MINEKKNKKTLSSSRVQLMPAMDGVPGCTTAKGPSPERQYSRPGYKRMPFVDRFLTTPAGDVPVVKSRLNLNDKFSTFYVRCGIRRYSYTISPGLYAVGMPDTKSEILVTANFKLSFDHLRRELDGINAWILVLDTRGINVWCAAAKGTFSTRELVHRIDDCSLENLVDHRRIIVPQLGAVGVSAKQVKQQSGFKVVYGPIRASDIPFFLNNHQKADPRMRMVTFSLHERLLLTPIELSLAIKPAFIAALVLFILSGIGPGLFSFSGALSRWPVTLVSLGVGIISGALLTPVLLPFLPPKQFAAKGIITGTAAAMMVFFLSISGSGEPGPAAVMALFLFSTATSSYLAMNFTGTTPFTSPSGVEKEMKHFIPIQAAGLLVSAGLWIYSAFQV